ncbi:MAG: class I SAM-dependent methyltransferase [Myxococcota bacterium]|nr:class I SAM-dependent methyltransferase [Myxococcota bacterium]
MQSGRLFFETYVRDLEAPLVVDVGSVDINGSLASVAPPSCRYVGLDFAAGKGVDVLIEDPYVLPLESGSVDVIVSSSCFEHSEMFWVLFLEILRVLKPSGLLYVSAPSNGYFHRHPVDCWRFYPDAGRALVTWAKRNGLEPALLESFVSSQSAEDWSDFVAVFVKDASFAPQYPRRIVDSTPGFANATLLGRPELLNFEPLTEDQSLLRLTLAYRLKRAARRVREMLSVVGRRR